MRHSLPLAHSASAGTAVGVALPVLYTIPSCNLLLNSKHPKNKSRNCYLRMEVSESETQREGQQVHRKSRQECERFVNYDWHTYGKNQEKLTFCYDSTETERQLAMLK